MRGSEVKLVAASRTAEDVEEALTELELSAGSGEEASATALGARGDKSVAAETEPAVDLFRDCCRKDASVTPRGVGVGLSSMLRSALLS
jgi:hypothetical protein